MQIDKLEFYNSLSNPFSLLSKIIIIIWSLYLNSSSLTKKHLNSLHKYLIKHHNVIIVYSLL